MNNFFKKAAPYIVILAGILFLFLGYRSLVKKKTFVPTTAVISSIEIDHSVSNENAEYHVTVTYVIDGKTYNSLLDEYNAAMNVGDSVNIKYNPENPEDITYATNTAVFVQLGFGAGALALGIYLVIKDRKKETEKA